MASMRNQARESYDGKLGRMGLKVTTADMGDYVGEGHVGPAADGTQGTVPNGYADGYKTPEERYDVLEGKKAKPRLDRGRPSFNRGGSVKPKGTTVNVIVAPQGDKMPAPPMGMPPVPPVPPAPPMPAGAPPVPPGMPAGLGAGPMPMPRKKGGRVPYTAGALNGKGKQQKMTNYGDAYAAESKRKG